MTAAVQVDLEVRVRGLWLLPVLTWLLRRLQLQGRLGGQHAGNAQWRTFQTGETLLRRGLALPSAPKSASPEAPQPETQGGP